MRALIIIGVLAAILAAYYVGANFADPGTTTCPEPTGLQVNKDNSRLEVNLTWTAAQGASSYLIIVSDSADVNTIITSKIAEEARVTLQNLPAGKAYVVSVYSKCGAPTAGVLNPNPVQSQFNTNDWIIIVDDIVHVTDPNGGSRMNDTICPKIGTCISVIPTSDRFGWTTSGEEVYSMEIARADNPSITLARGLIIKNVENNQIEVKSHINVECANNRFRTFNEPRKTFCYPQPTQSFCGNFTDSITGVPYQVQCDKLGFKVVFPNGNNNNTYVVTVKNCVPDSKPK